MSAPNTLALLPTNALELERDSLVRAKLARAKDLQGSLSDNKFARKWLGISGTVWSRIQSGTYNAKDWSTSLEKILTGLQRLEDHLAASQQRGDAELITLASTTAGLDAVAVAQGEPRDRLVMFLAPTGGGKSSFFKQLREEYSVHVAIAEASEPWRGSYMTAIRGLAKAIGMDTLSRTVGAAERELLDKLRQSPKIIGIDEAHYFGPGTINLVKAILNQSASTVVLGAIPFLWDKIKSAAWQEAAQLRNRTCSTVRIEEIPVSDMERFCRNRLPHFTGNVNKAAAAIRQEANRFGLWDVAEAICVNARADAGDHAINLEIVHAAIEETRLQRN